jgi:LuxR family maltose regulon positive regulatory protein
VGPFSRALSLDERDLAFDADESFAVLQSIAPRVDIEDAEAVISTAEGWAAALVAGAVRMRAASPRPRLDEEVAVELLGSWFGRLPERLQVFLIATAVLGELSAGPAAAVTGDADAAEILLELEAHHAYVRPIPAPEGHSGRWWRRHRLLTELLLQRSDPGRLSAHSAAADWFMATGDVPRSMHHLVASGRTQDAGRFLTDHESGLFAAGQADQILQWYDQIGGGYHDRIGQLIRVGWGQAFCYDIRAADATLAKITAERSARRKAADRDPTVADDSWYADEALLQAYLAGFHADPSTMIAAGRRALAPFSDAVVTRDATQLAPLMIVWGMLLSGQYEGAHRLLQEFEDRPFPNDLIRELRLGGLRAQVAFENGYVTRAAVHVQAARRFMERMHIDQTSLSHFTPLQASACVEMERGNVRAAVAQATEVADISEAIGNLSEAAWARMTVGRANLLSGDYAGALRALGQARALATTDTPDSGMLVPLHQVQALAHLVAGDAVRAERLIRGLPPGDARSLLWARAGLTRQPALARRTLEGMRGQNPRVESQRHLLLAGLHLRTSRRMAQGHLRKAAAIAAANGLAQLLAPPSEGLLEFARDTALEYQDDHLLWLLQAQPSGERTVTETPLSRGELQLLALLPTRARNADIAASLGISVNTVKTRLRRLYAKLRAGNRDEAITRARERGLLVS